MMGVIHKVHMLRPPSSLYPLYTHIHFEPTAPPPTSMSRRIAFFKENMTDVLQIAVNQRTTNDVTK